MKYYPICIFSTVLAALAPTSLSAFTTVFPSSIFSTPNMEVAGLDGWTINNPGSAGGGPGNTLSYVTSVVNGTPGAALGGTNTIPLGSPTTVFLSHAESVALQNTSFSTQFTIAPSDTTINPGMDVFGFSFRDSGNNNLLTISLAPVASLYNNMYQVNYRLASGPLVNALDGLGQPMYIFNNGLYTLSLYFTPAGANPTFEATVQGPTAQTFSGTATGLGGASIDRFGAVWNTLPGQEGNNFIAFDNVTLVPEPSSALLICLAGLGFVARRKRA